jgi:hypothetical protein
MTISTDSLHYNPKTKTFSEELSTLGMGSPGNIVNITNPKTNVSKTFTHYQTDHDGSGEDIAGFNYFNQETNTYLLLIND